MPLFLTASGLYSKHTMAQFLSLLPQVKTGLTACIITTADVQYKNKSKHAVRTKDLFYAIGFAKVDYVDLDTDPANLLLNYDIVHINGGNPLYLLARVKDSGAHEILAFLLSEGKLVSGQSAGAAIFGSTIQHADILHPEWNETLLTEFSGLGVLEAAILPHSNRYRTASYETVVKKAMKEIPDPILFLGDGEYIILP
ncbi:Type 1 glutamine amidotransferase-like domain-containing protein [Paenibacillus shunpengii]|uniref:Type 1 glutamine amidotransferase-like domain-containing protein n=1 Tax=Paenibacillus shunpengii TaxID=2054424 RepID=A0ABW5SIS5_9BACL|nr:Type 1 glutamine amidotransferase-like domain-containing protein [Paenibacillus sp. PDC88]SDW34580.1 Peptidase E [Paenibacillus sp. PDC88]